MILREIEAVYKHSNANKPRITSATDVVALVNVLYPEGVNYVEQVKMIAMNNNSRVLGTATIGTGGLTECVCDIRVLFQRLLLANATCFILVHNHPRGNCKPSRADDELTKNVNDASRIMKIRLLDHIIVTEEPNSYYSYNENSKL